MGYIEYHSDVMQKKYRFEGKKYLDVGCGNGTMVKYIVKNYAPEYAYGIDLHREKEVGEGYTLMHGDATALPFEDNTFDIVSTIATFEHINGIPETLAEIRRVLKPFGKCYIAFSPIWTSVCGHHVYSYLPAFSEECKEKGMDRDEELVRVIPPWGHLYMSPDEMEKYLLNHGFEQNRAKNVLARMYFNNDINRHSATELRNWIVNSGMIVRNYFEHIEFSRQWAMGAKGPSELTEVIKEKVEKAGYNITDLGIVGMDAELEKYANL